MLDRIPELQVLAGIPSIARALKSGDPHKVYRALWWGRLKGSLKDHQKLVDGLLAKRRLFLKPIRTAPGMFTLNGIGATIYGDADRDASDSTYIGTYFITFLFMPIFPLRQYLCRSFGKQYQFFGVAPFGTFTYLWRQLLAFAVVIGLVTTGLSLYERSRHNDLIVANGFDYPIEVTLAGERVVIPSNQHATRRCMVGKLELEARTTSGTVVDRISYDLGSPPLMFIWNIGGAALVYEQKIPYSADRRVEVPDPLVFCGQASILRPFVDYPFTEQPKTISMSSHESIAWRTRLDMTSGGWRGCSAYLARTGKVEDSLKLAESQINTDKINDLMLVVNLKRQYVSDESAVAWIEAKLREHDGPDLHRVRQDTYAALGKKLELRPFYRKRYQANPDSPDAAYLWVRTLPQAEALAALPALRHRWPAHLYLRRSHAWHLHTARQFEPALVLWKEMRENDDDIDQEVEALVGLGRAEEALKLLQSRPASSIERAVNASCIARTSGKSIDQRWLKKLPMDPDILTCLLQARVSGEIPKESLSKISDPEDLAIIEATALLHTDGPAALKRLRAAPSNCEENLDAESLLLLLGEALHAGDQVMARRLDSALPHLGYYESAIRVVSGSGGEEDLDDLPFTLRAAAELAASRRPGVNPATARKLREAAMRDDVFRSMVSHAATNWSL